MGKNETTRRSCGPAVLEEHCCTWGSRCVDGEVVRVCGVPLPSRGGGEAGFGLRSRPFRRRGDRGGHGVWMRALPVKPKLGDAAFICSVLWTGSRRGGWSRILARVESSGCRVVGHAFGGGRIDRFGERFFEMARSVGVGEGCAGRWPRWLSSPACWAVRIME